MKKSKMSKDFSTKKSLMDGMKCPLCGGMHPKGMCSGGAVKKYADGGPAYDLKFVPLEMRKKMLDNELGTMPAAPKAPDPSQVPVRRLAPEAATPSTQPSDEDFRRVGMEPNKGFLRTLLGFEDGGMVAKGAAAIKQRHQLLNNELAAAPTMPKPAAPAAAAPAAPAAPKPAAKPTDADFAAVGMAPRKGFIRSLLGMASGGEVDGPGGPRDDKIPAMLSDGEYVLPADTVKKVGVENLDKLRMATHKFADGGPALYRGTYIPGEHPYNKAEPYVPPKPPRLGNLFGLETEDATPDPYAATPAPTPAPTVETGPPGTADSQLARTQGAAKARGLYDFKPQAKPNAFSAAGKPMTPGEEAAQAAANDARVKEGIDAYAARDLAAGDFDAVIRLGQSAGRPDIEAAAYNAIAQKQKSYNDAIQARGMQPGDYGYGLAQQQKLRELKDLTDAVGPAGVAQKIAADRADLANATIRRGQDLDYAAELAKAGSTAATAQNRLAMDAAKLDRQFSVDAKKAFNDDRKYQLDLAKYGTEQAEARRANRSAKAESLQKTAFALFGADEKQPASDEFKNAQQALSLVVGFLNKGEHDVADVSDSNMRDLLKLASGVQKLNKWIKKEQGGLGPLKRVFTGEQEPQVSDDLEDYMKIISVEDSLGGKTVKVGTADVPVDVFKEAFGDTKQVRDTLNRIYLKGLKKE